MHHLGGFFAKPRPFLPGDFVTTDAGTGLVHMSPDHGEDDFLLCKANGIDPVFAVDDDGRYREDWAWLGGQGSVINNKFNAPDGPICSDLREAGALLAASADFQHIPIRTAGGPRRRSSSAARRNGSSRWTRTCPGSPGTGGSARIPISDQSRRRHAPLERARAIRNGRWVPRNRATASARWSRAAPTG